jgi:hypothetical protein
MEENEKKEPWYAQAEKQQIPDGVAGMESLLKLNKDLREAVKLFDIRQARYLIYSYFGFQRLRVRSSNQVAALTKTDEPNAVISWLETNGRYLENQIKSALELYGQQHRLCRWATSIHGIGPILSVGLFANIDLVKAHTASHIWRFCGLDPSEVWLGKEKAEILVNALAKEKEGMDLIAAVAEKIHRKTDFVLRDCLWQAKFQKRKEWNIEDLRKVASLCPHNQTMKVICWKIGESFNRTRRDPPDPKAFYGNMLAVWHADMNLANERGEYKERADKALADKKYTKVDCIKTLKAGKMPDGWILATAKRKAVKTFLFHYYQRGRELAGLPWVKPYSIAHKNHADFIDAPPMVE